MHRSAMAVASQAQVYTPLLSCGIFEKSTLISFRAAKLPEQFLSPVSAIAIALGANCSRDLSIESARRHTSSRTSSQSSKDLSPKMPAATSLADGAFMPVKERSSTFFARRCTRRAACLEPPHLCSPYNETDRLLPVTAW